MRKLSMKKGFIGLLTTGILLLSGCSEDYHYHTSHIVHHVYHPVHVVHHVVHHTVVHRTVVTHVVKRPTVSLRKR
jgi:hypothetical protein